MKYFNYILIVIGAVVAMYAKSIENQYILIGGIVMLMLGVYRLSKTIPSRKDEDNNIENE